MKILGLGRKVDTKKKLKIKKWSKKKERNKEMVDYKTEGDKNELGQRFGLYPICALY